jgi:hypothetical protein
MNLYAGAIWMICYFETLHDATWLVVVNERGEVISRKPHKPRPLDTLPPPPATRWPSPPPLVP